MNVYIAGSSQEPNFISSVMQRVRDAGHVVTHDWVEVIRARGEANPGGDVADYANQDLDGVDACDVLLLVAPIRRHVTIGAWVEFGYALAREKPVVVITDWPADSIFYSLATVADNVPEALALLEGFSECFDG